MNLKRIIKSLIITIIICIYFIPLTKYITSNIQNNSNNLKAEINILKDENKYLKKELESIGNLKLYQDYKHELTHILYKRLYDKYSYVIEGGQDKNYTLNDYVINDEGFIGLITEIKDDISIMTDIRDIKDFPIIINNQIGTISKYENNFLIVPNMSNYDSININDTVYTSNLGRINKKVLLGTVTDKKILDTNQIIYIKPIVNFNNLNYIYVLGE